MKKGFLPTVLFASFLSLLALPGCKKESTVGIDNDQVVKTPYSLYVANSAGWLLNSNDGQTYSSIFPPDGYAPSLILTSGSNLLFLKDNLHLSTNNGKNFNPVYTLTNKFPWQSMAYDAKYQGVVYIASKSGNGIAISKDNGAHWADDVNWAPNNPPVFEISSFAGLPSGAVFAYSNINNLMFKKDNASANWTPVTNEGFFPVDGAEFYLSSNSSTLFLTDHNGIGGVWYSVDQGFHWLPYDLGQLPGNHHWNCAVSPQEGSSLLVGTDSLGVYRADQNNKFVSATVGLEKNTTVYSMTLKQNTYKNDAVRNFVFIASNKGVYRSEDNGQTWDKMTTGEFDGVYEAAY
jgi:hypothetical protein